MSEEKSKYNQKITDLPRLNLTDDEKLPSMTNMLLGENAMVSFIDNPPGCEFPVHSHEAEQILIILEGSEEHICGDETFTMKAGDVCIHPPNVPHGGTTKTGFKGIDIFSPPRPAHIERLKKAIAEQNKAK